MKTTALTNGERVYVATLTEYAEKKGRKRGKRLNAAQQINRCLSCTKPASECKGNCKG